MARMDRWRGKPFAGLNLRYENIKGLKKYENNL